MQKQFFHSIFIAFTFVVLFSDKSIAHELRPSIADFSIEIGEGGSSRYKIVVRTNLEAVLAEIGPGHSDSEDSPNALHYNRLRQITPEELEIKFDAYQPEFLKSFDLVFDGKRAQPDLIEAEAGPIGDVSLPRESSIVLSGDLPSGAVNLIWSWPANYGASVIRITPADLPEQEGYSQYLKAGQSSDEIDFANALPVGFWQNAFNYVQIGYAHIIPKGLDHILFVIGLFLLSTRLKPLLWQVTAFTLAHTITLALATLGVVNVSAAIVEPLIAASIAYVAIENLMTAALSKFRAGVIFVFGLLHGLGFASVLGEIGLSHSHFISSLIAFNIGVEIGQLVVIAICFIAIGYWFGNKPWYRTRITIPASLLIAAIAIYWFFERIVSG